MKSKLNNYLAKGIAGLGLIALSYSLNSQDLPIYEKEIISSMNNSQQELLDKSKEYICLAREKIYDSAKDFYIDTLEQKDIKSCYDSAKNLVKVYNNRSLSNGEAFSDKDKRYYDALEKNLKGIDIGKPKLEKIIQRDIGYNVKIQRYLSDKEQFLIGVGAFFTFIALACIPLSLLD